MGERKEANIKGGEEASMRINMEATTRMGLKKERNHRGRVASAARSGTTGKKVRRGKTGCGGFRKKRARSVRWEGEKEKDRDVKVNSLREMAKTFFNLLRTVFVVDGYPKNEVRV